MTNTESIEPCLEITQADLDQREAFVVYVWEEVARRSGGRAVRQAGFQKIANEAMAEGADRPSWWSPQRRSRRLGGLF
jgi:hypothetical protein